MARLETSAADCASITGSDVRAPQKSTDYPESHNVTGKSAGGQREALMKMIVQESVKSLLGQEDQEDDGDNVVLEHMLETLVEQKKARRARRKSERAPRTQKTVGRQANPGMQDSPEALADDIYNSPIAGGKALPSGPKDIEGEIEFDDSFTGGCLDDLVDAKHRMSSQSKSLGSSECTDSATSSTIGTKSADSMRSSAELSVDEIRQYVLDHIPQEVREQIPESAWSQIFAQGNERSRTSDSRDSSESLPSKIEEIIPVHSIILGDAANENVDDDIDDNATAGTDVSGLTSAFPDGKQLEYAHLEPSAEESSSHSPSSSKAPSAPGEGSICEAPLSNRNNSLSELSNKRVKRRSSSVLRGRTRLVTFDQVEVRYYERVISDNPAVRSGVAIGIGWRFDSGGIVDVDYWEESKGPPRKSIELFLPRHVREHMLRDAGFTQKEMADMVRIALRTKNRRKQTVNNLPAAGVEEAVENATRKVSRLLNFGRNMFLIKKQDTSM
jgi:hypothetical protein